MDIKDIIASSISVKKAVLEDDKLIDTIKQACDKIVLMYKNGGKLLLCGNGGSAADAQHLAAEFSGRYYLDRPALNAEALHVNSSFMTAVSNDFGFDKAYARMIEAIGNGKDVLLALSTSGSSPNIIEAIKAAKDINMAVIGLTGEKGGKMKELCDILINVPSDDTPRIQESHIMIGHIICEFVENELFA
ncbi:MAG: D-sedoheptulose-7-phosphate isomerase [Bacteroidota bacterium]